MNFNIVCGLRECMHLWKSCSTWDSKKINERGINSTQACAHSTLPQQKIHLYGNEMLNGQSIHKLPSSLHRSSGEHVHELVGDITKGESGKSKHAPLIAGNARMNENSSWKTLVVWVVILMGTQPEKCAGCLWQCHSCSWMLWWTFCLYLVQILMWGRMVPWSERGCIMLIYSLIKPVDIKDVEKHVYRAHSSQKPLDSSYHTHSISLLSSPSKSWTWDCELSKWNMNKSLRSKQQTQEWRRTSTIPTPLSDEQQM